MRDANEWGNNLILLSALGDRDDWKKKIKLYCRLGEALRNTNDCKKEIKFYGLWCWTLGDANERGNIWNLLSARKAFGDRDDRKKKLNSIVCHCKAMWHTNEWKKFNFWSSELSIERWEWRRQRNNYFYYLFIYLSIYLSIY